jgi:hypothetical protein
MGTFRRAKTTQWTTAMRKYRPFADGSANGSIRPLLMQFKIGPMNGREARESGLRLKAEVAVQRGLQPRSPGRHAAKVAPKLVTGSPLPLRQ